MKIESEGRQVVEMMQKFQPGSEGLPQAREPDHRDLKAKMEAGKEQAEREITLRQAETMATLYKEVQAYAAVGRQAAEDHPRDDRRPTTPPSGSDPNSVMAAVSRPVIYADPAQRHHQRRGVLPEPDATRRSASRRTSPRPVRSRPARPRPATGPADR